MDSETFKEYLEKRYYDQLNYYEKSSGRNQKKYKNFQWVLIILSALTPVLAALNEDFKLQFLVVIVSAIVAILTTGLKTFQYQELWANYRATCEQLKPEIHYYNFNVGPYGMTGVDKEALFISRVETILDKEHQGWPPAKKIRDDRNLGEKENSGTSTADTTGLTDQAEG
ncbi:MAG TPA: DUF4231 domain-containing protein [Draconibacterium sp.]|nr:DUF4231 domain-containing protein [Draconibacterium sp.]